MKLQASAFRNWELVTIAVALLGGDVEYRDREDIAIEVNCIAPGRFNWRKYPERIDLDAVGAALRDAKKTRNGSLLVGSNAHGWMLSPSGFKWFEGLDAASFGDPVGIKHRRESIEANQQAECARLRRTRAYQLFMLGAQEGITLQDLHHFARVDEYFQTRARQRRYTIVENAVTGDVDLSRLWEFLKREFAQEVQ